MIDAAESPQRVQITWGLFFAFVALALVAHEAHELIHITVGRLVCGGWGTRDFNSWTLPSDCTSTLPTLAGPVLSFSLMWIGSWLLGSSSRWRPLALGLVFAPNPFARLLTAGMGGGDEGVLVRAWTGLPRGSAATALAAVPVALLVAFPLWRAWNSMARRRRLPIFIALLLMPTLVTGILLLVAGNRLLAAGLLAKPEIAGTPPLIWLISLAAVALLLLFRGHLERRPGEPARGDAGRA